MQKKGDLSMSTIVMAVIAVLILIILASIIIGNLRNVTVATQNCQTVDGVCSFDPCSQRTDFYTRTHPSARCLVNGQVDPSQQCCIVGG